MLTYSECKALMARARNPECGKPLSNNTRLFDRGEFYAVQLHKTDVVEIYSDGTWGLYHDGWTTQVTAQRIHEFSPASYRTWLNEGDGCGGSDWWVYFLRDPKDPKPEGRERTIPKPFYAPDPGPEPVKPAEGCIAGTLAAETKREQILTRTAEIVVATDELPSNGARRPRHANRARDVLAFIDHFVRELEHPHAHLCVEADVTTHTVYGEESYPYRHLNGSGERVRERYEQCPHCKAFAQRHASWKRAMFGKDRGRGFQLGYSQMCEWLETFGSREAWQEEYITEFREVREAKRLLREWTARNRFNWRDGVIVIDSDGQLTKKCSDERRKADRARRREQRRREREEERRAGKADRARRREEERRAVEMRKRAREAAQLERFKARVRAKRGEDFTVIARDAAHSLASLAQQLDRPTNRLESADA